MRNIRLLIEYDGTNYAGWQWQKNAITIQETLSKAIEQAVQEKVTIYVRPVVPMRASSRPRTGG